MVKDDAEIFLKVIGSPEHTWFAPFYVHSLLRGPPEQLIETIVKTVDIYTYFCPRCEKVDACLHTNAVRNHVIECMDRFYFSLNKSDVIWGVASEKHFERGITTMGVHKCSCGASSDSYDVLLPGGYITNTLGSHYLIYHRGEIPISQIRILEKILK